MTSTIAAGRPGAAARLPADVPPPLTMGSTAADTADRNSATAVAAILPGVTPAAAGRAATTPSTTTPSTTTPSTTAALGPDPTGAVTSAHQKRGLRTVTEPAPLPDVPVPVDQAGIDTLRMEIDAIDAQLVTLIQRRTAISHAIGSARASLGGTRIVYSREMAVLDKFRALGSAGTDLGMLLLSMGRGQLGRR